MRQVLGLRAKKVQTQRAIHFFPQVIEARCSICHQMVVVVLMYHSIAAGVPMQE